MKDGSIIYFVKSLEKNPPNPIVNGFKMNTNNKKVKFSCSWCLSVELLGVWQIIGYYRLCLGITKTNENAVKGSKVLASSFKIPPFPKASCGLDWILWWVTSGPRVVRLKPLLYMDYDLTGLDHGGRGH